MSPQNRSPSGASLREPDRLGFNLIVGICACSIVDLLFPPARVSVLNADPVGQASAGTERLLKNGDFDETVERFGSSEVRNKGGVHELNSPSKGVTGQGVMCKQLRAGADVADTAGRLLDRLAIAYLLCIVVLAIGEVL